MDFVWLALGSTVVFIVVSGLVTVIWALITRR